MSKTDDKINEVLEIADLPAKMDPMVQTVQSA